jgi:peptidoglycan/xylan/chitin deacetylase (PgdA/CDA1 family)
MLAVLLISLAASPPRVTERSVIIDGKPLPLPAVAEAGSSALPMNLLVSSEERTFVATLLHRGWTPRDFSATPAYPEIPIVLGGRTPDLELEHAGNRIDERFRLALWRRPERLRGLPLWDAVAVKQSGVRPLLPPSQPPASTQGAVDRALADFSFGLSQARVVAPSPRVTWIELVEPPPGAEDLLIDLPPAVEPPLQPRGVHPPGPPALKPLPPFHPVAAAIISRPDAGRRVALTFDACSTLDRSFYDDRVTRVLVETHTPATLFISGRWAETHLRQMRILAENPLFEIANHSFTHPHMTEVPPERQREELLWTQQVLFSLSGRLPRFFRPPYGEVDAELAQQAAASGLRTVEYDFPSGDPDRHITRERLVAWVLAKARPGSIVVMHMNRRGWHTAEALPEIIAGLRAKGFVLSQVGSMVDGSPESSTQSPSPPH